MGKILLGTPCKCYYKDQKGSYVYNGYGYYVGKGYCVLHSFTDIRDDYNNGISPTFISYDRYIPCDLKIDNNINKNDFNTENIIDIDNSNLNEFWWWHKIQNDLKKL